MTEPTNSRKDGTPAQAPPTGAPRESDPTDRAGLTRALCMKLRELKIGTRRVQPTGDHPLASVIIRCQSDALTQDVALSPDPARADCYEWRWLWSEGLRGEGRTTTEHMCAGEEIETATAVIARVLGIRPVAV